MTAHCVSARDHQTPSLPLLQPSPKGNGRLPFTARGFFTHTAPSAPRRALLPSEHSFTVQPLFSLFSTGVARLVSYCARSTRVFLDRALREHRRLTGHPFPTNQPPVDQRRSVAPRSICRVSPDRRRSQPRRRDQSSHSGESPPARHRPIHPPRRRDRSLLP